MTCNFHCAIVTKPYVVAGSFLTVNGETVSSDHFPLKKILRGGVNLGKFKDIWLFSKGVLNFS